jgi:hypothetical protein
MQIIENWTDVTGKVTGVEPSEVSADFVQVQLKVSHIDEVEGYANLLAETKGQILSVQLPQELAEQLKLGEKVSCRLRKGNQQHIFAHPDQTKSAK